jgi:sugar O-acyltransferase (sialic acid O-acetyltransferase NeuD family)
MARRLVIIGNSGSARECYWTARDMLGDAFSFRGFLSFEGFSGDLKELAGLEIGNDDGYRPGPGDEFVIGIGKPALRAKAYAKWKERGARFISLIHPGSFMPREISMGEGNIIGRACFFSCNVTLGNANYCNGGVAIGHDVCVGDANLFGPSSMIMGGALIGSQNSFGVRAVVLDRAKVGDGNTVAPGAFVYKGCGNGRLMAGNPALDVR